MRLRPFLAFASLSLVSIPAMASSTWMTVMLDGQKVGKVHIQRDEQAGQVVTTQSLDLRMARFKTPLVTHSTARIVETADGLPVSFSTASGQGADVVQVDAESHGPGVFQLSSAVAGQTKVTLMQWPEGATLPEGQRLAIVRQGFTAGTHYSLRTFQPEKQQVANLDVSVVGDEMVDLPGGQERLHHLREALAGSGGSQWTEIWVNDRGEIRRSVAPMLAYRIEMAVCDEACASAPDQDVDVLRSAMSPSPRLLPGAIRVAPIRYRISVQGNHPNPFVETDEQRVSDISAGVYQLDVGRPMPHGDEPGPTKEDTEANPWVQSDAPAIRDAAEAIVGSASSDMARMRRLRAYLTDAIDTKGMDIGYASALDTLQSKKGDCTEHAVLLTAFARSLGIPARVVTGLVYVDRFAGANRVFIPHAWTQAWINGRWVSFDSAQGRYDATHIALGVGDGAPWHFFEAMASLGSIHIERATPTAQLMDMPPESARPGNFQPEPRMPISTPTAPARR
ncbi:transglutaminase-like domain-containing protein [Luteibacter aegosomatissinici]|uniref:transglutaminase-like domain-containing protein n=1 Tax=Luteibacter aegosomatissinici TaxID=2911539 RepID=UPI001FF8D4CE|nr:transglutaminase-like domain-containing protein [Luteibacter aegosomatissinici]UPG93072.1 transglutaminase-like domain-containing protein [Luteibacter aegosomatissinici]